SGKEPRLAHVEHKQRRHAVIGKPLPRLGEGKIGQPNRLAKKRPHTRTATRKRSLFQHRHACALRLSLSLWATRVTVARFSAEVAEAAQRSQNNCSALRAPTRLRQGFGGLEHQSSEAAEQRRR